MSGGGSCAEGECRSCSLSQAAPIIALSQCSVEREGKNGPRSQLIECKRFVERSEVSGQVGLRDAATGAQRSASDHL